MSDRVLTIGNFGNALQFSRNAAYQERIQLAGRTVWYKDTSYKDSELAVKYSTSQYYISQGFKTATGKCSAITLYLNKNGNPSGNIWVEIQGDNDGVPDNNAITNGVSQTKSASSISSSGFAFYNFIFSTPPSLNTGTQYHLVLKADYDTSTTDNVAWGSDNSSPTYSNGAASKSDNSATPVWTADNNRDMLFAIDTALASIEEDITIEARIRIDGEDGTDRMILEVSSAYGLLINSSNQLEFQVNGGGVGNEWADDVTSFAKGVWYHIALTYDKSAQILEFYVNSKKTKIVDSVNKTINLGGYCFIGNNSGQNKPFVGGIDEVRVSKIVRTFTIDSIQTPYTTDSDTLGLWHLDEGANTVYDASIQEREGSLENSPTWIGKYGIIQAINDSTETTKIQTGSIGDGQITNAKIADSTIDLTTKVTGVLPVAHGGTGLSSSLKASRLVLTGGNFSTSSTSFTDVTGASITITTGANPVLVIVNGNWQCNGSTRILYATIDIDADGSTIQLAYQYILSGLTDIGHSFNISYLSPALTAGSHTIKLRVRIDNGAGTLTVSANANVPLHFTVIEQLNALI